MVSLQKRFQSSTSAGLWTVGAAMGIGTWFQAETNWPQWRRPSCVVEALDGFVFGLQPAVPVAARVFVEGGLGEIAAEAVVNLPRDQLRMLAERAGHIFHDALGIRPINVAVQADGAARAFVLDEAAFVHRAGFPDVFGEPDGRRGGGRAEHDLNAVVAQNIHHALEPVEIEFAVLLFAQAPGEFADADDVEAGGAHELGVLHPLRFGIFGGAAVREDPLFRVIINAEIHKFSSGSDFIPTLKANRRAGN